uniref:Nicotinamide riboside kinase 2 n=1 Tax=Sphaerodactylus townsendi TaxID=933632 RepID=A0ACB8F232_9SAUR
MFLLSLILNLPRFLQLDHKSSFHINIAVFHSIAGGRNAIASKLRLLRVPLSSVPICHLLAYEVFCRPLIDLFDKRYYLAVPYEECKQRRSTRKYTVPDPPGLFDGHVWPMYLKHRKEMEASEVDVVYLDGLKSRDDLYMQVFEEIQNNLLNAS